MLESIMERGFTQAQLDELTIELRKERTRVQRTLARGESSDELHDVLQALQRIEDGNYGFCLDCGRRITLGRLQVMPATRACVGCAR